MAFCTVANISEILPEIYNYGISSANVTTYGWITKAENDIKRQLRNEWWLKYQSDRIKDISYLGTQEMDSDKLTDSQYTQLCVFRVLGWYMFPALSKWNPDGQEDKFQMKMKYYRDEYDAEWAAILRDGVEYDADDDDTITNVEKEPLHGLRLTR
jgi:hypothetical protein